MYAQLCKRLSLEAPNNDSPNSSSTTFLRLLLNICRDKFENRSNDNIGSSSLITDDEEKKYIAKQKMLGNVKFIGELSKLDMLSEGVLHTCILSLFDRNRADITIQDRCEDMECLSQLIRTCGKKLETEKGKPLMDQYFEKMAKSSKSMKYPARIRFMLRDVIELRRSNWIPRKVTVTEGPVPIHQLRTDDDIVRPQYVNRNRDQRNHDRDNDNWMNKLPLNLQSGFNEYGLTMTGSSNILTPYNLTVSGGTYNNRDHREGGGNSSGNTYRNNNQRNNQNLSNFNNHNRFKQHTTNQHNNSHNFNNSIILNNKDLAPRFKRNLITPPQDPIENLQFRPAANTLISKANVNIKVTQLPLSQQPRPINSASAINETIAPPTQVTKIPTSASVNNLLNKDQILIKQASLEKPKQNKKDKGPNKEEVMKRVTAFLQETLLNNTTDVERNMNDIVLGFIELKVPDKYMKDTVITIFNEIVDKNELSHERAIEFLVCLRKQSKLNSNAINEGFKSIINGLNDSSVPRISTLVASIICRGVIGSLCTISDISNFTEGGQHYPLLLLVLQQLHKHIGKEKLIEMFNSSKINIMSSLPEADRTKDRLAAILEDRNLSFLYPLLKVQGELQKQIQADSNPQQFYKWIKDNVEQNCFTDPGFVTALMTVLLKYITQESTLAEGVDPLISPDKVLIEKEKTLMKKYCPVLQAFLNRQYDLQLVAIYALQVFCYSADFPKGMLLRWFTTLYELNVIEEDSFLRWKEDLSDVYMGKGNALFQVNTWLTWLAEAESEEDDE